MRFCLRAVMAPPPPITARQSLNPFKISRFLKFLIKNYKKPNGTVMLHLKECHLQFNENIFRPSGGELTTRQRDTQT
jgi:hypothetical protein